MVIESLLPYVTAHGIIFSFLGGFITGESIIIPLAFLAATDFLPIWYVLIFSTLGMYLSDFVPFSIGRIRFLRNLLEKDWFAKKIKKAEDVTHKYTRKKLFLTILYSKFIYGASIPTLIYLGYKKTSYTKFAFYNLFVELFFVPILVLIGWLSGKGFNMITTVYKSLRIGIFLIIIIIIILFFIKRWMNQKAIRLEKELK